MINEQENKASNGMSDLEYTKNDTEMMRYRVNGLSNKLGLVGMGCSIFAAFICLNSMKPATFQVIIIILMNIVVLLGGFLANEKVKNYSKAGSIAQIVFGGVCAARIFWIPVMLISKYTQYAALIKANASGNLSAEEVAANNATIKELSNKYLGATITSKESGSVANAFLPSSGTFRGVFAIVLLALAATAFIIAGIIGYQRAAKLEKYLDSLKVKN